MQQIRIVLDLAQVRPEPIRVRSFERVAKLVRDYVANEFPRQEEELAVEAQPPLRRATAPPGTLVLDRQIGVTKPGLLRHIGHPCRQARLRMSRQPAAQCGLTSFDIVDCA